MKNYRHVFYYIYTFYMLRHTHICMCWRGVININTSTFNHITSMKVGVGVGRGSCCMLQPHIEMFEPQMLARGIVAVPPTLTNLMKYFPM